MKAKWYEKYQPYHFQAATGNDLFFKLYQALTLIFLLTPKRFSYQSLIHLNALHRFDYDFHKT
jgi:hypothetical protein